MRRFTIVIAALLLAACSTAPVTRQQSQAVSTSQSVTPEAQKASIDSLVEFLVTSAATDFNAHRPPDPAGFRNVRLGRLTSPDGEERYMLCGEFLPKRNDDKAAWTPFVTIKTSGYEQYLGPGSTSFCQSSSVVWERTDDLSSLLQSRYDALK